MAQLSPGLFAVGCCLWSVPALLLRQEVGQPPEKPRGTPPGHPECWVAHIPRTHVERALWAGLGREV
ncbi:DUF6059 family protein [Streptomyces sp. NPDC050564]|uniref:DUF6059 family protein n=1 Tax=Streptomyces sp. NPDC050564 TaxID=3365631 RepID=UPI0037ACB688